MKARNFRAFAIFIFFSIKTLIKHFQCLKCFSLLLKILTSYGLSQVDSLLIDIQVLHRYSHNFVVIDFAMSLNLSS